MNQKSSKFTNPTILKRKEVLKAARALLRIRFAAALDEEIARVVPQIEHDFDTAVLAGQEYTLDILALLDVEPPKPAISGPKPRRAPKTTTKDRVPARSKAVKAAPKVTLKANPNKPASRPRKAGAK